jgi:hypothetical protein
MKTKNVILIVLLALAPACSMAQAMYKCVQDGKTTYQATPCPDAAKQDALRPQNNAAPPAKNTPKPQGGAQGVELKERPPPPTTNRRARAGIPTVELKELPPLKPLPFCCKRKDGSISPEQTEPCGPGEGQVSCSIDLTKPSGRR